MSTDNKEVGTTKLHTYKLMRPGSTMKDVRWIASKRASVVLDDLVDPDGARSGNHVNIPPNTVVDLYEILANYHKTIAHKAAEIEAKAESIYAEKESAVFGVEDPAEIKEIEERIDNELEALQLELMREMNACIKTSKSLRFAIERKRVAVIRPDFDPEKHEVELVEDVIEVPKNIGGTVRCPYSVYEEKYNKQIAKIKKDADEQRAEPFAPAYRPRD